MIENKNRNAQEARSIEVAEESRELDWKSKSFMASLFMGELDLSLAYPFPEQSPEDKAAGDELCARVDAWANEHLDGGEIDATGVIPAEVFSGLNELGLWGIKIPKKYGGLGMSQTNYMRVLSTVALHCGSTAATLSAHQSIGVPQPLKLFGTDEQKERYLPRIAKGAITAFALTEPEVGSDPANMTTTATLSEDGTHWVLNGVKLWCTNGVIADLLVVMARTPDKVVGGKARKQISAFIVDGRAEGVEVLHRCEFMGIRAIENGLIRFTNVKVPVEDLIWGEGKGLKLALTTLNDGRLGIPAIAAATTQEVAAFSARWARSRNQWGKNVGEHEAGADKLARISAGAYAMESLSSFCAALSDRGEADLRMEAAAAKMYNTELSWELFDTALQLRGGRGYETAHSLEARGEIGFPMERGLRDSRINRIVEGTTDVMHLFLAREALDKHLQVAGGMFKKGGMGDKLKTLAKMAGFYPLWYAKLWMGGLFKRYGRFEPELATQLRWVDAATRKLGRTLFHKMATQGPKLEMRQLTLARIVDIGAELGVMALVATRTQTRIEKGDRADLTKAVYWLRARRLVVEGMFRQIRHNVDADARKLAGELMAAAEPLPELVIPELEPRTRELGSELTSGSRTTRREQGPRGQAAK